jgi:phosphate:Na+ symporter
MKLFGGLAMFLSGLDMLSEGLKKAAGKTLKNLLSRMTSNRLLGAATGAFITAVLNSSSVTTVLVVSFISAGVMTLPQSVGVIMGANIGSTMTAQLLAFNISSYALFPIAVGFFMGMGIMSEAMSPLRTYEPFMVFLKNMERPLLGIFAGALFTGLVQSSAATVGIAIAMATEGLLTLPAGITLALGANIGTCATALLASMGKPPEAVRAAIIHVLFNIVGVIIWLPLIRQLAYLAIIISPGDPGAAIPRQIANANTIFNVINTVLFIGFTHWFANIAQKIFPDRPQKAEVIIKPKYLDEKIISIPTVALEQVRMEFGRMGKIASRMLSELLTATQQRDEKYVNKIIDLDDKVDILEAEIFKFLSKVRQQALTKEESRIHQELMTATVNLENLADVIETDMSGLIKKFIKKEREVSETTRQMFRDLHGEVLQMMEFAVQSIRENDQAAALKTIQKMEIIQGIADNLLARKSDRLGHGETVQLETNRIEISLIDKMLRICSLSMRIAGILL